MLLEGILIRGAAIPLPPVIILSEAVAIPLQEATILSEVATFLQEDLHPRGELMDHLETTFLEVPGTRPQEPIIRFQFSAVVGEVEAP